jgi:hypothetical protein
MWTHSPSASNSARASQLYDGKVAYMLTNDSLTTSVTVPSRHLMKNSLVRGANVGSLQQLKLVI